MLLIALYSGWIKSDWKRFFLLWRFLNHNEVWFVLNNWLEIYLIYSLSSELLLKIDIDILFNLISVNFLSFSSLAWIFILLRWIFTIWAQTRFLICMNIFCSFIRDFFLNMIFSSLIPRSIIYWDLWFISMFTTSTYNYFYRFSKKVMFNKFSFKLKFIILFVCFI
jgi:hypothetical protein